MCVARTNIVVVALLLKVSFGDECASGSCVQDETSLVQLQNVVKRGADKHSGAKLVDDPVEESPDEMETDDEAVTEISSTLDDGAVQAAFSSSKRRHMDSAANRMQDDLAFADQVDAMRKANKYKTEQTMAESQRLADKVLDDADVKVADVVRHHEAVQSAEYNKVKKARENYEAHTIKRQEVQDADAIGKWAGRKSGEQRAAQIKADHDKAKAKADEEHKVAQEKRYMEQRRFCEKCDIEDQVEKEGLDMEKAAVEHGEQMERLANHAVADADASQKDIEGPEAIKHTIMQDSAMRHSEAYDHDSADATKDMKDIVVGDEPEELEPEDDMVATGVSEDTESIEDEHARSHSHASDKAHSGDTVTRLSLSVLALSFFLMAA